MHIRHDIVVEDQSHSISDVKIEMEEFLGECWSRWMSCRVSTSGERMVDLFSAFQVVINQRFQSTVEINLPLVGIHPKSCVLTMCDRKLCNRLSEWNEFAVYDRNLNGIKSGWQRVWVPVDLRTTVQTDTRADFTAGFGMGPGVTPPLWPSYQYLAYIQHI